MRKYISLCFLWMLCATLWGQSNNGYGGSFDPVNPDNPISGTITRKYELKLTTVGGGSISKDLSGNSFSAGTSIYLNATPNPGYKFKYWTEDGKIISVSQWHYYTMPAKKSEVKAVFEYNPDSPDNPSTTPVYYKITVSASSSSGGSVYCSSEKVKVGTYTYVSASPYTGYKFAGWYLDGKLVSKDSYYYFEVQEHDMHFTAKFVFNPDAPDNPNNGSNNSPLYTIEYKIDGELCHVEHLPAGTTITAIKFPVKEGYTYSGWKELPTIMPAKNIVVDGTFIINKYKVIYYVDGEEYVTNDIEYGSPVTLIAKPEKEGHTFSGWSEAPETMPAKDITISGTFSVNSYKITWKIDGEEKQVDTINYGTAIVPPTSFEKEGYLLYWSNKPETMPAKDIVVDGTYSLRKYLVTYIANDSTIATDSIAFGSKIEQINAPDKEGYTFIGWAEVPETMPAKDIVLTAKYSVNKYNIKYVIGEDVIETVAVEYGSTIEFIEEPTKEGYTFSGWSCEYTTMPAKDIVVNGSYNAKSYTITYKVDDKEYKTENVAFGTKIQLIEAPTKEGYTFSGWSEAPETMPAKDITISGTFTVNSYKVTYMVDGAEFKTVDINFGEKIELIATPTKDGYTFSGWSEAPETMPAKDITISGSFGVNSYNVTYMVDGKEYQSVSLAYGSAITLIDEPTKEGHTFSGWSETPESMPAKDITISGTFSVNSYKITYMVDGAEFKTVNVNFGEKIELIAAPIKNGFTFSGWSEAPETMPAKDIVINGSFDVNSYKVTYMVDGKEYQSVSLAYGSTITLIDAPTKEGHTFSGWSEAPETMPAKNIVINGSFTVNSYKVTYMVDGTEYKTVNVNFGEKIVLIDAPAKDGFTFSGWSDAPDVMPAKDIVINGSFGVNSYKVTYMVDGKEYQSVTVNYGSAITLIDAPTKEGHTFSSWKSEHTTMPAKDITISGTFTVNSYKVTYKVDGTEYKIVNVNYGEKIVLIDAPAKDGFTFSGWTDAPETMPAKDITISGTFGVNSYKVTYMVDGKEHQSVSLAYGSTITLIDAPTKEGHTFSGWSEAPETMPAKDITISGTFSVNSYKVTYMVDGAEFKTVNVNFGEKIVLIDAPAKDGFTFSGWSDAPDVMPAKDIVINGSFGVNSYKVTYMVDGKEYQSVSFAFGSTITLIDAPTKEGHTFSGWKSEHTTMPAKDITISGTFSVNSYKVTYMVDGANYKTVNVNFGEKIVLIDAPIKNGFTFSGWSEAPETMPAKDIVINGSFGVNSYKVTYMVDGKEYQSVSLAYGSAITLIDAPTKEGHTFSGWSEAPETMPAKDITINGSFAVNSYKVTYKVDGADYKTVNVNFGEKIVLIDAPIKNGFTFSGWSEAPETMPAKDIVINGSFGVNSYKVTYMVDGKEYQSVSFAYGSAITLIDAPTKEGHTFSGWSEAPATMPAKDIVINGSFAVNSYKITYMVDGTEYKTINVNFGEKIVLIDAPTKDGFTFSGWTDAPDVMPAKDIVINGKFLTNAYTITYMVDGKEYRTIQVSYGEKIQLIDAPTKEGYTFSGWSETPESMPAKDITISGTFSVNSYKITYMVDGAEYKTVNVNFGEKIVLIDAPAKEGFTFSGWTDAPETMPAKDIVINGKFLTNAYSVTYMVDGKEYRTIQVSYGEKIQLIDAPTKEGYTFSGWSEAPETMPAKDIVINGSFTVNSYKVTYKVDGAEYKIVNVNYGEKIVLIDAPAKDGFTFSGWSDAPDVMLAKDIVINGSFGVNSYKVTYMVDGKEYQSVSLAYGSAITLIDEPTKEGHTFSGWSEAPETMPAKDIVINGSFAVNSYKVTYKVDGADYKTVNVNFGEKIVLIDAPTKDGFTFSGWSEAPETMPAKDIVINGSFAVNSYKVTYMVDGKEYQSVSLAYGSAITLIGAPIKEGHTFSGWSEAPKTMPAKDIVINGSFAVNSYKVTYMVDGTEFKTVNVNFGEKIVLIDAPTKDGFTFSGWTDAPDVMPAKDIVINGKFLTNAYSVTYMVDGKEYRTIQVSYGEKIQLIDAPTKEGYTFNGWSEAPATMPAKDITISGTFSVNSYKVTYMVDGAEFKTVNVNFGEKIELIAAPIKNGFTFSGWSEAPETMPAKDIVISGTFGVNSYKVTYMIDGKEYQSVSLAYGSAITLIGAPTKEGHTFSGWSEAPETMPAKDITISGTFSVNSYKITYKVDGTEYKTVDVNFGEKIELIATPIKNGFTFSGWSEAPETMPAKDIVINGSFGVNSYKVTYMVDGKEYQSVSLAYGSAITLIDAPTKEGHTFSGWSEAPATMPAKDIVINGSFAVNSYKTTYMVDGTEYKTINVNFGEKIVLIDAPAKDGFTFSGWTDAPDVMPAKDIVINGKFLTNAYTITYMVDGKEYRTIQVSYGAKIELIGAPAKEGHTFSGWSEAPETMPAKDIVINGSFTVNSYKVTYMVDGAEYKTVNVNFGEKIVLIDAPAKDGYTFSGWTDAPDVMPAKDIVINGKFLTNAYSVTYMVDGKEYRTIQVSYGEKIQLIDAPTKEGYTFSGWSEAPETMPAKDITISGTFSVNSYKITYMVDGAEFKTVDVNFGEKIELIAAPTKNGFTFSGWSEAPETMPAKDIVINGSFAVNSYKVTYMVDGKEYQSVSLAFGSTITLIDEPTKEGHTFSGWSEAPETMPAKDITISGTFSVNSYKVTYMVDGAEYKTVDVNFGEKIVLIDTPAKDGYTFSGWTDAPDVMPAKDIIINGKFLTNAYSVTYMVDGKEYRTIQVSYGAKIELIGAPDKEGHTFSGWGEVPESMPAKDIVLTAEYSVNNYAIIYIIDEDIIETDTVAYGSSITLIDVPTKEGHTFSGWSEAPETMPAKDITISGTFSVNYYTLTYIVDGDVYKEEQVAYGSEIVLIDAPTKEDYIFSGWSDYPATMPAENVTITGSFVHTSISGISADAIVKISENSITLSGANNNTIVIYTTNGALVEKIDNYAGEEIQLDKGIYIISIDGKVVKIRL